MVYRVPKVLHPRKCFFVFRTQSGLHVTVGDDMGKIWVYDVGEALAIPSQVTDFKPIRLKASH